MSITDNLDDMMDDFINDDDEGGGGNKYLKDADWKKRTSETSGHLDFWLQQNPFRYRSHPWPTLWENRKVQRAPNAPKLTSYFPRDYFCEEHESVHTKRIFRNDDGSREVPPTKCGFCLMIEWIDRQVAGGQLDWCAPVFKFQGTDPKSDALIMHAGGLTGLFNSKKLTDQQIAYMNERGIFKKYAYKEKLNAEKKHKLALVDNLRPELGILISTQKEGFVGGIRTILKDRKEAAIAANRDPQTANPLRHPFMFRAKYDKEAENMSDVYTAIAIDIPQSDAVKLALAGEAPDLKKQVRPFSPAKVIGYIKEHMLIDMPVESFFAKMKEPESEDDSFDYGANAKPTAQVIGSAGEIRGTVRFDASPGAAPAAIPTPPASGVATSGASPAVEPCDDCGYPMLATDTECPKCHAKYGQTAEAPPTAEQPKTGTVTGDDVPFFQQ